MLRFECVKALRKILEAKVFFAALKNDFAPKDAAFANFLILTALRRKSVIEKLLKTLIYKKIANKNKILEYILLSGATEILYMDTPDYAAINEYVQIAKHQTDKFSAGMVNAVLRKVICHKDEMKDAAEFSKDFRDMLRKDYDEQEIKKMERMLLVPASTDLSVKSEPEILARKNEGLLFENGTVRLTNQKKNIAFLAGYEEGDLWVQDLAASLPVCFLENLRGKKVLDLCAAPGGKTAQLAAKGAMVTAVDINPDRVKTLRENMKRLRFEQQVTIVCEDALTYLQNSSDMFDFVLLDAPCSATGTYRKHPEVLHLKTQDDVLRQIDLQDALLDAAAKHVAKNGVLLYCTCSLLKAEGESRVEKFLNNQLDFKTEAFDYNKLKIYDAKNIDERIIDKKFLRTLPYYMETEGGMDGFFAACLRRLK